MEFALDQPSSSDVTAIADLINAHSLALFGTRRALIDEDGDLRTTRYIPGAAEQMVARNAAGRVVGHVWWINRPPHVVVEIGLIVHPDCWATAAVDALLAHVEVQAGASLGLTPEGARVVLQTTVLADDHVLIALLQEGCGFAQVREWVHFETLPAEAPVIHLPQGVTIREMDQRFDWPAVGAVMDEAFADHWGEMGPHVRTLLEEDEADEAIADGVEDEEGEEVVDDLYSNSLGLCFVAEADGQVIGSCLCNARTIEWPASGKLGSLSVLRPYRRLGVGRALTATALAEFHRRGIQRIITDTDNASFTGANRLYPRFGFRPYRYEHVYEKELRAGVEWRALSPSDLRL